MIRALRLAVMLAGLSGLAGSARADAPDLAALHDLLVPLRDVTHDTSASRDAAGTLTIAKHRLRDWIEAQIEAIKDTGDDLRLTARLEDAIRQADLACTDATGSAADRCDRGQDADWNARGFVDPPRVELQHWGNRLAVRTGVGMDCGFDQSAYVYARGADHRWHRLVDAERAPDGAPPNDPLEIDRVETSDDLVLVLGQPPHCQSAWTRLNYRLWRTPADGAPQLLLDANERVHAIDDPPFMASVGTNDVLLQFRTASISVDEISRTTVRHLAIEGNTVSRIDPLALGPRNFVEEWIAASPDDSAAWTERPARAAAARRHAAWHDATGFIGTFLDTTHCSRTGDVWQVGVQFEGDKRPTYFLVRWEPPYRFRLVGLVDRPRPDCQLADPEADASRTLFPVQEWR